MLPADDETRKRIRIFDGFIKYFPDAIAAVAELSVIANDKHNPGEPLHWAKGKSTEQRNSLARHLLDEASGGPLARDDALDGVLHATESAWRALAQLQTLADQGHNIFALEPGGLNPDYEPPDANCYTLPNGDCVSSKDCMHGPAITATEPQIAMGAAAERYLSQGSSSISNERLSPAEEQELDFIESLNRDGRGKPDNTSVVSVPIPNCDCTRCTALRGCCGDAGCTGCGES